MQIVAPVLWLIDALVWVISALKVIVALALAVGLVAALAWARRSLPR